MDSPLTVVRRSDQKPAWLKVKAPGSPSYIRLKRLMGDLRLNTVCEEAHCPNIGECWHHGTATFMILGDVCTRSCAFCGVTKGEPRPVDADEPRRVGEAAKELGLRHVVITCVTRDDLSDGGAEHFCRTVAAVRGACDATVEVLPSDFGGNRDAVDRLIQQQIQNPLAVELLKHGAAAGSRLKADCQDGEFLFERIGSPRDQAAGA